ncbi:MAG TPA: hypothetical protein VN754_10965 [Candidatus Binataceae bacterium]|nr:hypothetical protein [Candidatus Binataceae bacterium]
MASSLFAAMSAGFWFAVKTYRNRARVAVEILEEDFYSNRAPRITFEAENRGLTPTSVKSTVVMTGFLPRPPNGWLPFLTLRKHHLRFIIDSVDRLLAPHTPLRMTAVDDSQGALTYADRLGFLWFKTYTFTFTRGRKRKIRIRSAELRKLSFPRYVWERWRCVLTGRVTVDPMDVRLDR